MPRRRTNGDTAPRSQPETPDGVDGLFAFLWHYLWKESKAIREFPLSAVALFVIGAAAVVCVYEFGINKVQDQRLIQKDEQISEKNEKLAVLEKKLEVKESTANEQSRSYDINRKRVLDAFHQRTDMGKDFQIASENDLSQSIVSKKIVFINDVPRGPNVLWLIEGKRFQDCVILGPALIVFDGYTVMNNSVLLPLVPDPESILWEVNNFTPLGKTGTIGARSTSFDNCHFFLVGFVGPKEALDPIRNQTRVIQ